MPDSKPAVGPHFRGFHATVAARNSFPRYLFDCFFHPLETLRGIPSFEEMVAFDSLIYIRHSTCDDPTGLAECYAHELQHFVQYGRTPRLWAVNSVLYENLKRLEPASTVIDIPTPSRSATPHNNDWLPGNENPHGKTSGDEERLTIYR